MLTIQDDRPLFSPPVLVAIMLGVALGIGVLVSGCESILDPAAAPVCSSIPDGNYAAPGASYAFAGGLPGGMDCGETPAGCAGSISCSPRGETVYTVAFVYLDDGDVQATTSPPGDVVTLSPAR